MNKHKVVIVGAGFGGVKAALSLAEDRRFAVTLINEHADFRYYPTLFRTATGGKRMISSIALGEIFAGKSINIVMDSMTKLDRKKRTVTTKSRKKFPYDALIIGIGVQTNYFGIKGLQEFSYGIKTPNDAEELKQHLHQQMINDKRPDLNYVVIGGGPTGIELAGALPAYLKKIAKQHSIKQRALHVDLIEAAPRLLPRMPKKVSRRVARHLRRLGIKLYLGTAVQAQTADELMVNGKPIRSHTVIWTAGVTNHPFFAQSEFQLAKNGKVRVDQFLQSESGIYVIGDNADTPYSGLAQTALRDGAYVAKNLKTLADGQEPVPYLAKRPIYVLPAGHRWAAVVWGNIHFYGFFGWVLRRLADLVAYHDYQPWRLATKRWLAEDDEEDNCPTCIAPPEAVLSPENVDLRR